MLKAVGHQDNARRAMTDAKVLTTALVAAYRFGGNVEHARRFLRLGAALKDLIPSTKYLLGSFPVAACDNIRIRRAWPLRRGHSMAWPSPCSEAALAALGRAVAAYYKRLMRKRIETGFSRLTAMFPRHIHAVNFRGFLLKVSGLIIFALDRASN